MAAWVTYLDMAHGQTVLTVDDMAVEVFTVRSTEGKRFHLSHVHVEADGPDRKGRHRFVLQATERGAARVSLFPDEAGVAKVQAWLAAVDAARATLPSPLA